MEILYAHITTMKKFFDYLIVLMVMVVVSTMFPSCGKDDEPDNTPEVPVPSKADVDDSRIFGTWEGEFFDDIFILTFSKDGIMTETVNGDTEKFSYSLKNGSLEISPAQSTLNNVMGEDIKVSFTDNSTMTVKCDLWSMTMAKTH